MQVLAQEFRPAPNIDLRYLVKLWLFEVWAKKFGAKVVLKDIAIEQRGNQRLFAIAYLNSPVRFRKCTIQIDEFKAFEDVRIEGIAGVFLIDWKRPVGVNIIHKILNKFGRVFDYLIIIAERFSGIVEDRYSPEKNKRVKVFTDGDLVSELRREGVL